MKKHFNTVHDILLSIILSYCIRGIVHKCFSSCLDKRQQYVEFSGSKSECRKVICGVPQGLVLGPIQYVSFVILYLLNFSYS